MIPLKLPETVQPGQMLQVAVPPGIPTAGSVFKVPASLSVNVKENPCPLPVKYKEALDRRKQYENTHTSCGISSCVLQAYPRVV